MRRKPSPAGKWSKRVRIIATVRKREVKWAKSMLARMKPLAERQAKAGDVALDGSTVDSRRIVAELEKIASGEPVLRGFEIIYPRPRSRRKRGGK